MQVPEKHGLKWVEEAFGWEPQSTLEPSIDAIKSILQQRRNITNAHITFFAQGAFNKLYRIDTDREALLLRVALPVDPRRKTASEVATIKFLAERTTIPIPKALDFDASNQNVLGLEWMLMELKTGQPIREVWKDLDSVKKATLVRQLARYQAELFDLRFQSIGNLYPETGSEVNAMVAMNFFWARRSGVDTPRGPFANNSQWLSTRLSLVLEDQNRTLRTSEDSDEIEDAETSINLAEQLRDILPFIFPPETENDAPEPAILFHDDFSMSNILVGSDGQLTALVDWECESALPLWRACQLPELLLGNSRTVKPQIEKYGTKDIYWEHLEDYDRRWLRKVFWEEMERLRPAWIDEHRRGELKRGFNRAVSGCDNDFRFKRVQEWIDAFRKGRPIMFRDGLEPHPKGGLRPPEEIALDGICISGM